MTTPDDMKPTIVISVNTTWNIINFRAGLVKSLVQNGFDVVVVSPPDKYVPQLEVLGCRYFPLEMNTKGTTPIHDLILLYKYFALLKKLRPSAFLGFTIKPNIYGSVAARWLGIPAVNNIAGLGTVFVKQNWLTLVVKAMYRFSLRHSYKVFFQNTDDLELFEKEKIVNPSIVDLLPGSGVDIDYFSEARVPRGKISGKFSFILIARLLWEKGVQEFISAARMIKEKHHDIEFNLLGFLDDPRSGGVPLLEIDSWVSEGVINYLGSSDDVRCHLATTDCVVLPSYYREGVPRSLIEAAAMGKPIITTDSVGCREVVEDGVTGFLCEPRNSIDLYEKMLKMIELSKAKRQEMGSLSRIKAENEFDEKIIIGKYLAVIQSILEVN
jgi:glycosyltransferase involved in cell wall biosynthesis